MCCNRVHAILSIAALLVVSLAAPAQTVPRKSQPALPQVRPLGLPGEISDERILEQMEDAAEKLIAAGKTTKMGDLIKQLGRRTCSLNLPEFTPRKSSATDIAIAARPGLVILGDLSKCRKCPRWHVSPFSGFLLTADGVVATCYHAVNIPASPTLVAMTSDGRVFPVKEVLAANPDTDVALLRLEGERFTPLPLDIEAPVGSAIRVLSHPDGHFFSLTEGMVSRYVSLRLDEGPVEVTFMAVTADFGTGSSGAPVFNERGGVVAIVNNTQSLYYDPKKGRDLQMVFKHCLPSQYIRQLIERK